MMILTVHNLAKTYKLLPSEALGRASTFDLYVLDVFHRYSKYQEARQQGKAPPAQQLSVQQMKAMIEQAKKFKPPREQKQ
jgi:hypothetical protein